MGVMRWLDRVDPEKWKDACAQLASSPPLSPESADRFLKSFGKSANEGLMESFSDLHNEPSLRSSLLNSLLEEAVKEESWDLDKSLSLGFERLPHVLPGLKPLAKIIDFKGIDIEAPPALAPTDSGLIGCISTPALADCLAALAGFPTLESVRCAVRQVRPGLVGRLLGRQGSLERMAARLDGDYLEFFWGNLGTAVRETSARNQYLALGMSV